MNPFIYNSKLRIGSADLIFPVSGRTSGTPTNGTLTFSAVADLTIEATGSVTIVSVTRSNDALWHGVQLRLHQVVISCPNNQSGTLIIKRSERIRSFGNHNGTSNPSVNFYAGTDATMPILTWNLNNLPALTQRIRQSNELAAALPTTGNRALPTGLTYLYLSGANINWTFTGALPTGLTFLYLLGNNINWTFTGALPTGLTLLHLLGNNINWTGAVFGNTSTPKPNMGGSNLVQFLDYRNPSNTMDYTQLLSMLDSLINNVGTLPTTVIIREQISANVTAIAAATANEFGNDAERAKFLINTIKSTKGVTTFTLNTTNI